MSHIHVCLVSDQPIPNLTTVFQLKPDAVVLLTTKEMEEKTTFLLDVLKTKGIEARRETIEAYDINNVMTVSDRVINQCSESEVSLNITGGTKIGTLGTFQAFYTAGKPIFYVDTKNSRLLKLFPEKSQETIPITVSIRIKDYLSAYGFQVTSRVTEDKDIRSRAQLSHYLATAVARSTQIIASLNRSLHEYGEKSGLPVSIPLPEDPKLSKYLDLLDGASIVNSRTIEIHDYSALRYLKGIWFEEYVYLIAKDAGADDVWLNIEGKWLSRSKHHPRNEFDVMISKGTRLFYISCKTANPDRAVNDGREGVGRHFLYELDSLSDKALGLFGKKMLASARPVDDPAIRERAKGLGIDLVDGKNITTLKETIKQWIKK